MCRREPSKEKAPDKRRPRLDNARLHLTARVCSITAKGGKLSTCRLVVLKPLKPASKPDAFLIGGRARLLEDHTRMRAAQEDFCDPSTSQPDSVGGELFAVVLQFHRRLRHDLSLSNNRGVFLELQVVFARLERG